MSQPRFAELIGVSAPAIASIETGRLSVSEELADRISIATGVDPETIIDPGAEPRYLNDGKPYTAESYQDWKAQTSTSVRGNSSAGDVDLQLCEKACDHLALLLGVAGNRNRLVAVLYRFQKWEDDILRDYGLEKDFEAAKKAKGLSRLHSLPLFQKSHAGITKLGKTKAATLHKKVMTPALQKVADAFKEQAAKQKSAPKA